MLPASLNIATEVHAADSPAPLWGEATAGVDVASDVWLLYSGVTLAPMGAIYGDGLRVRAGGGYGQYRYSGRRSGDAAGSKRHYRSTLSYVEGLLGYQVKIGALTTKAFVGIAAIDHNVAPADPISAGGLLMQGDDYGIKGALELWLDLGPSAWTSLDASWTSAHQTFAGRWRLGYRLVPTVSIGVEAGINGNIVDEEELRFVNRLDSADGDHTYMSGRLGLFARYDWNGGEISLSGGVTNSAFEFGGADGFDQFYGTVNWITRF